jgi:hypothetical protein
MFHKSKPNKIKWSEYPPIFNKSILFNSIIKFIKKNKFYKERIKIFDVIQLNKKHNDKTKVI